MSPVSYSQESNLSENLLPIGLFTFAVIGLLIFGTDDHIYKRESTLRERRKSWPTTPAQIVQVERGHVAGGKGSYPARIRVNFTYNVGGKNYAARQSDFLDKEYSSFYSDDKEQLTTYKDDAQAEKLASDFESHRSQTAHYDPSDPQIAYIDIGYSALKAEFWRFHLIVGCLVAAIVLFVILYYFYGFRLRLFEMR